MLLEGNTAELIVPDDRLTAVEVTHPASGEHYVAQVPIGAKLAGMYEWEDEAHTRRQLPPLYFGVVSLPDFERAEGPQIRTPLAKNRWSSLWDQRNRLLYLVVQSSARNDFDRGKKLSFHIE